jgi:FrmR/RcnR family transcriptional regulator, repressor of frmRAB operon
MAHTIRSKGKLLARVRRIRGQVEAVERSLDREADSTEVLRLIAACRGAMNSLMVEVLEGHIREHALAPDRSTAETAEAADELVDIVRSYLK